jgi:hypothetical protein
MQNLDDYLTKPVKIRYIPLKRLSTCIRSTIQLCGAIKIAGSGRFFDLKLSFYALTFMREDKSYAGFLLVDRQIKHETQKTNKIPRVGTQLHPSEFSPVFVPSLLRPTKSLVDLVAAG